MTQYISGTVVPIFRSIRLYTTAYGFQYLTFWRLTTTIVVVPHR